MDGWMDGWMDGRTDGWMDGWIDQEIDRLAGQQCPYLNVSQPENAIPERHHIDPLAGRH